MRSVWRFSENILQVMRYSLWTVDLFVVWRTPRRSGCSRRRRWGRSKWPWAGGRPRRRPAKIARFTLWSETAESVYLLIMLVRTHCRISGPPQNFPPSVTRPGPTPERSQGLRMMLTCEKKSCVKLAPNLPLSVHRLWIYCVRVLPTGGKGIS